MKSVDVLIPNHNSEEVIKLAIESVLVRTEWPALRIIVHDDSDNRWDRQYLEGAEANGQITLVRGGRPAHLEEDRMRWSPQGHPAPYWHGAAVNTLLHDYCTADYAMLMDADSFILKAGWLDRMFALFDDEKVLVAAHEWKPGRRSSNWYVPGWWRPHFMMLNMAAYRDGMQVDWRGGSSVTATEPWLTIFKDLPESDKPGPDGLMVLWDPGSTLWVKMRFDNPKGYRGVRLPDDIENIYYHHFKQKSLRMLQPLEAREVKNQFTLLRTEADAKKRRDSGN